MVQGRVKPKSQWISSLSIKWNFQNSFGQQSGLLPYWIADTDFATAPEVVQALQKRCDHPVIGYSKPLPGVYTAIQGWWDRRHGWKPETDWMLLSYGVVTGLPCSPAATFQAIKAAV